jgi:hypothetical protein
MKNERVRTCEAFTSLFENILWYELEAQLGLIDKKTSVFENLVQLSL